MRLVILGPPGAGKGTQCARIARGLGVPHIGAGETFRALADEEGTLARRVRAAVEAGQLVDDDTAVAVILKRLNEADAQRGFLLDGFPRNRSQAMALGRELGAAGRWLDHAILLELSDDVAIARLAGRLEDPATGAVYHAEFHPPPQGVRTRTRRGDSRESYLRALQRYREVTEPMLELYEDRGLLLRIDASGDFDEVTRRLSDAIGTLG